MTDPQCSCEPGTALIAPGCLAADGGHLPRDDGRTEVDMVNAPPHYLHPCGVETIDASEHANFALGNAIKYVLRAPNKGTELLDLQKAEFYLKRLITLLETVPDTAVWLSEEGRAIALDTLVHIHHWEVDNWWISHPRPEFYFRVIHEDWAAALTDVAHLITLVKNGNHA